MNAALDLTRFRKVEAAELRKAIAEATDKARRYREDVCVTLLSSDHSYKHGGEIATYSASLLANKWNPHYERILASVTPDGILSYGERKVAK